MNPNKAAITGFVILLAGAFVSQALAGQDSASKVLFTFHSPGEKAPLVGFFYSADDKEELSLSTAGHESVSIPFRKIKQMTLTPGADRFSHVVVKRTDGGTVSGRIAPFNVLFIDPKKDRPYDLPLSDPNDYLADYGDRQSVLCALGTFTQQ